MSIRNRENCDCESIMQGESCSCQCDEEWNDGGGYIGQQGPMGPAGPAGPQGPMGPVGPAGPAGPGGIIGPAGPAGPMGLKGDTGAMGPAGPKGDIGAIGPQGPVGPIGPQGEVGPAGPQGPVGAQGTAGPQGAQGAQGAQGPQGIRGPQGDQGPRGPIGPQGNISAYGELFSGGQEVSARCPLVFNGQIITGTSISANEGTSNIYLEPNHQYYISFKAVASIEGGETMQMYSTGVVGVVIGLDGSPLKNTAAFGSNASFYPINLYTQAVVNVQGVGKELSVINYSDICIKFNNCSLFILQLT